MNIRFAWAVIFFIFGGCVENFEQPLSASLSKGSSPQRVAVRHSNGGEQTTNILVIYAQDARDTYPFPSFDLRERLFSRLRNYYATMSYGLHQIKVTELSDNGGYFRSKLTAKEYKRKYNDDNSASADYDGPFALFNHEILQEVVRLHGEDLFSEVNVILIFTTDGGSGWYLPQVNAMGFARLGFEFEAGGKSFPANYGGISMEIGSSSGSKLYLESTLYWLLAHEYAHWLGYRTHRPKKIGAYSLMTLTQTARLDYPGERQGPSPLDPFLIMQFGWLDAENSDRVVNIALDNEPQQVTLNQIRSKTGIVLAEIPVPGTGVKNSQRIEHFYVAYHRKDANPFDDSYAASGLLIWHQSLTGQLDIECGETLPDDPTRDHLDIGQNLEGLPTDLFNSQSAIGFTPFSSPNSSIWGLHDPALSGKASGISITEIREFGDQIQFTISYDKSLQGVAQSGASNLKYAKQTYRGGRSARAVSASEKTACIELE